MKQAGKRILAGVLTVVALLVIPFSNVFAASSRQDLQNEKQDLDNKISEARDKAAALRNESSQQMEFVAALRQETEAIQEKINVLSADIADLNTQIVNLNIQIEENEQKYEDNYAAYSQRLRALYMSGSVTTLEALLESQDLSDLLTRAELISAVSKQDQAVLEELLAAAEAIKADKQRLTESKAAVDASMADQQKQKADLEAKMGEKQAIIDQLEQQAHAFSEEAETDAQRMKEVEDELRKLANSSISGGIVGTGQMTMPCPGYSYVSAGYPNYSSGAFHGGIDFAAPFGTSIVAADSGTVIATNYWNYSFGYHVMISHGNGITTLYGHTSQILVQPGQNVSKGQVIARVGSTGNSTGNHLHFEVRINGERQNPWNYL